MRRLVFLSVLFALSFLAASAGAVPTNVTTCQTIAVSGVYTVNTSLFNPGATCLTIAAHDVDLDCQGNTISSNSTLDVNVVAVYVNGRNNFTAYNCRLTNYSKGFMVTTSSNVTLRNNSIWNMTNIGIDLFTTVNSTAVYNNTISYVGNGITATAVRNSTFYNNRVHNTSSAGIYLEQGQYNNVTNNTVWNGTEVGIYIAQWENNSYVFNNTIFNITQGSAIPVTLFVGSAYYTTIFRNTLYNNSQWGIRVYGGAYHNVSYNSISNQTGSALRLENGVAFSNFNYNTLNSTQGAYLGEASYNNTFRGNRIEYSSSGISLQTGPQNTTIRDNIFLNLTGTAISLNNASFNYVYGNNDTQTTASFVNLQDLSQNNTIYSNNVSFVYATAFSVTNASDNVFYSNRVENDVGGSAFNIWQYAYRNVFYDNVDTGHPNGNGFSISALAGNNTIWRNNVTFLSFGTGLSIDNSSYNNFSYNRIINVSSNCVALTTVSNFNTLQGNTLINSTNSCIVVQSSSSNNTISGNALSFIYSNGIHISNAPNNTVSSNTIVNVTSNAISVDTANLNRIISNVISNTSNRGIQVILSARNNTVSSNNVSFTYNGYQGILVDGYSDYGNVSYNHVENVTNMGIQVMGQSRWATVRGNTIVNTTLGANWGIILYNGTWYATVADNVVNYTANGIDVDTNSSNNTIQRNSVYFIPYRGIELQSNSHNNTISLNTVVNTSQDAIRVTGVYDNYVLNNTVTNATYDQATGIHLVGQALRNFVDYNNVSFVYSTGLNIENSSNNTVRYNRIFNTTYSPINVNTQSQYNTFTGNLIENATYRGITVNNASYNSFQDNDLNFVEQLEVLNSAYNNSFTDNVVYRFTSFGLHVYGGSTNNSFTNNNVSYGTVNYAVSVSGGSNQTYFSANRIMANTEQGVFIDGSRGIYFVGDSILGNAIATGNQSRIQNNATDIVFTNVTFSGSQALSQGYHASVINASSVTFVNATLNKSLLDVGSTNANLTVRWYVFPFAYNWSNGVFPGIVVNVKNLTAVNESDVNVSATAISDGSASRMTLTEFFKNSAYTNNVSSYNFSAYNPYTRLTNSSTLIVTSSGNYSVFISNDTTAPSVTLVSPADSAALTSFSGLTFSFNDAVATTANCTVYLDGASIYNNASVLNGTSTSISLSASYGTHVWNASCLDASLNQGNSSLFSFSLSSGTGSSSSATPAPTATPTATPAPTDVPVSATVEPSVEPSVDAPVSVEPTAEPVEEVVVPVEEVTSTMEPVVLESGGSVSGEGVVVTTSYSVSRVAEPSGGSRSISRVLVETKNVGIFSLKQLKVTREFKFLECLGPDPAAYEAVGVVFSPRPFRIECGSAVVTWLFDNVEPGESVNAEAKVPGELTREQVEEGVAAPRVVARAAEAAKATARPSVTAAPSVTPTPGGFDWTLPAIGVLVLLGAGAYFVFGRKTQGL